MFEPQCSPLNQVEGTDSINGVCTGVVPARGSQPIMGLDCFNQVAAAEIDTFRSVLVLDPFLSSISASTPRLTFFTLKLDLTALVPHPPILLELSPSVPRADLG